MAGPPKMSLVARFDPPGGWSALVSLQERSVRTVRQFLFYSTAIADCKVVFRKFVWRKRGCAAAGFEQPMVEV